MGPCHLRTRESNTAASILVACENPEDGFIRFPASRFIEICQQVAHLFRGGNADGAIRIDRLGAADLADSLSIDSSETNRALAKLGKALKNITTLPSIPLPKELKADLRGYQAEGFFWLQFLAEHGLHGILADDMGLGKTVQTLAHLCEEARKKPGRPSLVIAPTSVVPNWAAEAEKFTPSLKVLTFHGSNRADFLDEIPTADLVLTSYPLLTRDMGILGKQDWHSIVLDEAQYIKNPKAIVAKNACKLKSVQRICLSGTPMENHLGELWSLLRFLMPGFLGDEKVFNTTLRKPIERDRSTDAQRALNRRVAPLILRRTKDQVATELPEKTVIVHHIDLTKKQTDLYESVRAAMDKRVRGCHRRQRLGEVSHHCPGRPPQAPPNLLPPAASKTARCEKNHRVRQARFSNRRAPPNSAGGGSPHPSLFSVYLHARAHRGAFGEEQHPLPQTHRSNQRPRQLGEEIPIRRSSDFLNLPKSWRHRTQSNSRRYRHPLRPLVEPCCGKPSH